MNPVEHQPYIPFSDPFNNNYYASSQFNMFNCQELYPNSKLSIPDQASSSSSRDSLFCLSEREDVQAPFVYQDVSELSGNEILNILAIQDSFPTGLTAMAEYPLCNINIEENYVLKSLSISTNTSTVNHFLDHCNQYICPAQDPYQDKTLPQAELCVQSTVQKTSGISTHKKYTFFNIFQEDWAREYPRRPFRTCLTSKAFSPHNLNICGKDMQNSDGSTVKMFSCLVCRLKFNRKSNLTRHLKTHSPDSKKLECFLFKSKLEVYSLSVFYSTIFGRLRMRKKY
ncbi:C2H2-type zinc finger transcription factor [Phycomyces blakesleeanus]|uniref:C2H2-type zinc finger transcription factor n=2 Tax=Phycomyces blakesleeanus TaxID=4837 RepID=A0A167JSS5_PHYB8|nr:C2H2-type zinc finger transcription factor [Phycomyces blakesleeanus NRRL 1555(-)]OAD66629.1 C2H2-type zinc finger transcription factor [Phycomyces blakesleeanus NRRL 1555(-)]|eukprot:XP_018284669.1 C2H2-type zinc finger transcription factor [Phycomyces blakesleeanus NRRL 1555(-)]